MSHLLCLFSPVNCATTFIAKATLGDLFSALTTWILNSVQWFLTAAGQVLTSTSDPTTVVNSASQEFGVVLVLAPLLMMLGLLVSTLQALRTGTPLLFGGSISGSLQRVSRVSFSPSQ